MKDQRRIGGLQSNVDALNDRCSMLEMAMERERSERMQDTSEMQTQISREMHKLELAIETSKVSRMPCRDTPEPPLSTLLSLWLN